MATIRDLLRYILNPIRQMSVASLIGVIVSGYYPGYSNGRDIE